MPTAPPQQGPRALGFPCASDADLVCAFAHCQGGACGGCGSDQDCKTSGVCTSTPFGNACLARLGGRGVPAPPPVTASPTFVPPPPNAPVPVPFPAPTAPPTVPVPASADRFAAARQLCVDRTNEYRAKVGRRPVVRRPDKEPCIDGEAAADSKQGPHATMGRCNESAQNACPDYPGATPEATLSDCLAQMFAEGPGEPYSAHGHYLNMTEPSYNGVACGFFVTPAGKLWIVQDFYR